MTWGKVKDVTASSRDQLNRGAMTVVEKVQEVTGLKLRETLGWTSEKVEGLKATVVEKLEESENKVEKVEEVKTHV
jgi:MICOS complex subunit MIC26